jgi:zinc protease
MHRSLIAITLLLTTLITVSPVQSAAEKTEMALPTPHRHVFENGLAVLTVERHQLPIVELRAMIRAGVRQEVDDEAGLANLVARLLVHGTRERSAIEIAEAIDYVGGRLDTYASDDASYVSISVLSRDLLLGLDLLCQLLTAPTFPEEELKRERGLVLTEMAQRKDDPRTVVGDAFREAVFEDHPYHRPVTGYEETVTSLTREAILSFYERFYRPNNCAIAAVGDFDPDNLIEELGKRLETWERRDVPAVEPKTPRPIKKSELKLIDMDISQSYARFGHHGIKRNHPDYYAISVMNRILGAVGSGRIFREVREERGLAYDARARFPSLLDLGTFYASFETKIESTQEALDVTLDQIRRMKTRGVTSEELADAKSYLTGHFPLTFETGRQLAAILLDIQLFDLGPEYLTEYLDTIESVTKKDIKRVAQQYLDPEKMIFVVVTRLEDLSLDVPGIEQPEQQTEKDMH